MDESSSVSFCALEYRARGLGGASFTILLVFEEAKGALRFFVHPDWRSLIQQEDVNYISDLLIDALERAEEQPAAFFRQLSSLGVGPLVTQQTGAQVSDCPSLLNILSEFVRL